jgi:cleavage and polyadenylation specificity factor subunit 3
MTSPPTTNSTESDLKPYSIATSPTVDSDPDSPSPEKLSPADRQEIKRLNHLGIPVPGIEIRFDKHVARVWLEDLDVECASKALQARIKAVVERGVETVSGLWA